MSLGDLGWSWSFARPQNLLQFLVFPLSSTTALCNSVSCGLKYLRVLGPKHINTHTHWLHITHCDMYFSGLPSLHTHIHTLLYTHVPLLQPSTLCNAALSPLSPPRTLSLSLSSSLTHIHTHSVSVSHIHACTHTYTHFLSRTQTFTRTLTVLWHTLLSLPHTSS